MFLQRQVEIYESVEQKCLNLLHLEIWPHNMVVELKYLTKIVWCYNVYFGPLFFIQEELGQRSPILKAQTRFGSVIKAENVARDICRGVERGKFLITHGFDGFFLGVIATGMSPVYHWATLITEVSSLSSLPAVI